jgi:hypothetical protein
MESSNLDACWDAASETQHWRELAAQAAASYSRFKATVVTTPHFRLEDQFSHLCLAEFDAVSQMRIPECCSSRATMIAELRRLLSEPTSPSLDVSDADAYRASQKAWLEWIIQGYERSS